MIWAKTEIVLNLHRPGHIFEWFFACQRIIIILFFLFQSALTIEKTWEWRQKSTKKTSKMANATEIQGTVTWFKTIKILAKKQFLFLSHKISDKIIGITMVFSHVLGYARSSHILWRTRKNITEKLFLLFSMAQQKNNLRSCFGTLFLCDGVNEACNWG